MRRHQSLLDRLSAIEAQFSVARVNKALAQRPVALRHDAADQVSPVLQQLLAEVLPGALVLDWRQEGAAHAGRMAADGLVFRFRVDAEGVGYRPAWEGVLQRGWELRSDSFLQLRAPAARMDFRRTRAGGGQKRKCATGYGCGNACISLQKECRIAPRSAIGKGRLRRLQQLAAAGDQSAGATASQVMGARGAAAAALQKDRTTQRVQKLLERPEIAEFLRTGKLPATVNSSTEPGTVREMKPGEIGFDPLRFQYKINATATTGEVGSLSGVRKWDPNLSGVMSVWKDPADGEVYVVNGHNRLALARRLGAEAVTVRFLNAATATEARAIGALQNIAEGAGSPMDAAKFFRDTGITSQQDVEARGLPLGSGQASKGLSLSKLPGDVFNAVVRGDLTVNRGAIIGGSGLDDTKQREVFKMIGSRKAITDQTLQELVEHAAASSQRTQTTMSLFGETEEAKDNLITRAKLSAALKAKIGREKRLFSTVSKAKAASSLTEKGGNVINQEQSAKVAATATEALGMFERLKSSSGPISSALNRAADRVEAGEAEATVRKELERDVFAAVEQELVAVGLRKPRKDTATIEARIDALRRKCQTGYGCGSACISLRKECRSQPRSAMGKERMRKLLALAAGGTSGQRGIAPVRQKEAGKLAAAIGQQRGAKAAQLRGERQQKAAPQAQPKAAGPGSEQPGRKAPKKGKVDVQIQRAKPGSIAATLRQSIETMKAADAKQFGMLAQQLFESSWKLERTSRYRGKTKEQAMESFKQDMAAKMQQGMAQRATTPTPAPAGGKGSVAAALKASLEAMKASDKRLEQLTEDVIDLRIQAEEFGDDEPTGKAIKGRRRPRLGTTDSLQQRIDALKRKCATGYSCGASCISMNKVCRKTPGAGPAQQKMKRILALAEPGAALSATPTAPKQKSKPKPAEPVQRKGYNVEQEFEQSTKVLGETMTAAVRLTKGPPPGVVKKGLIGENEAEILRKLEGSGATPQLLGVSITGKFSRGMGTVLSANGFLAMSQMKGIPYVAMQFNASDKEVVKANEEYVRVRKKIHSAGVAHNDMHTGNFFYDQKTGKGGLVDFGLSEIGYRPALLEALGTLNGKDFQAERMGINKDQSPMMARLSSNIDSVIERMEKEHGIKGKMPSLRSSKKKVDAYLGSLSNDQARKLVEAIYAGL